MDFLSLARSRYSCRAYKSDPVPDDCLARITEAMRLAPTACNRQPFSLFVAQTAHHRESLRRCYHHEWLVSAPLVLFMVAHLDRAWCHRDGANLGIVDATIALDHLILAAAAEGLGTCWIAAFRPPEVRAFLGLPDSAVPVALTPLGFPADQPPVKERAPIEKLVHFIKP